MTEEKEKKLIALMEDASSKIKLLNEKLESMSESLNKTIDKLS